MIPPSEGAQAAPLAEIVIRLNANGSVSVTGPFQNQLHFYGLLKIAEQVCQAQVAQGPKKIVVPELRFGG